jgi:hypothetical protein
VSEQVTGRIVSAVVEESAVRLIIDKGTVDGVSDGCTGTMWRDDTMIERGAFTLVSVNEREARAYVNLAIETIASCTRVMLSCGDGGEPPTRHHGGGGKTPIIDL